MNTSEYWSESEIDSCVLVYYSFEELRGYLKFPDLELFLVQEGISDLSMSLTFFAINMHYWIIMVESLKHLVTENST